jgi:hypothetical protein
MRNIFNGVIMDISFGIKYTTEAVSAETHSITDKHSVLQYDSLAKKKGGEGAHATLPA